MLTEVEADRLVERLCLMPFAPTEPGARMALSEMFQEMIDTYEHGKRMVKRIISSSRYTKLPPPAEIRAVYCSLYPPQDGINAFSSVYPDGDFADARPLLAPPLPQLPAGRAATADPELDDGFQKLLEAAKQKTLDRPAVKLSKADLARKRQIDDLLKAIETAPQDRDEYEPPKPSKLVESTAKVVTQSDVEAEVAKLRAQRGERRVQ